MTHEPATNEPETKRPIGYQSWHDLLLVHWRVPAEICQPLLPAGLSIDTWEGDAWIGLVAFHMSGVRPRWFPALPYLGRFAETNVRTYVRCGDEEPGIWFFSLEAARMLAVLAARIGWRLPYHWARMSVGRQDGRVSYASHRWLNRNAAADIVAEIESQEAAGAPDWLGQPATPGSLEEFLIERYVFYNLDRRGRLQQGRVRHRPYPLLGARLLKKCEQSLVEAAGLSVLTPPAHVVFSPGLDVEIVDLKSVTG